MSIFTLNPAKAFLAGAMGLSVSGLLALSTGCQEETADPVPEGAPAAAVETAPAAPPAPAPAAPAPPATTGDPDDVLVDVDGATLTRGEVDQQVQQVLSMQAQSMEGVPPETLQQMGTQLQGQITEQFVAQQVLENEVARQDIAVSAEEVDSTIGDIGESLPEGMTLDMALQSQGMTEAELREEIEKDLRIRTLIDRHIEQSAAETEEEKQQAVDAYLEGLKDNATITYSD